MRTVLVLAAFSALTFACSHDATDAEKEGSVAAAASSADGDGFCGTFCKKNGDCDSDLDVDTCVKKCQTSVTPIVTKYRADIIGTAQRCYQSSDCKSVLAGDRFDSCLGEAQLDVTPSAAAKDFCGALEASTEKCSSSTSVDHVKCLTAMKSYSDATLGEARTCTQKACSAISDCVDATL